MYHYDRHGARNDAWRHVFRENCGNATLQECLQQDVCITTQNDFSRWCNLQTELLCGPDCLRGDSQEALNQAKQNLKKNFLFVGITERLEESLQLISRIVPFYTHYLLIMLRQQKFLSLTALSLSLPAAQAPTYSTVTGTEAYKRRMTASVLTHDTVFIGITEHGVPQIATTIVLELPCCPELSPSKHLWSGSKSLRENLGRPYRRRLLQSRDS